MVEVATHVAHERDDTEGLSGTCSPSVEGEMGGNGRIAARKWGVTERERVEKKMMGLIEMIRKTFDWKRIANLETSVTMQERRGDSRCFINWKEEGE